MSKLKIRLLSVIFSASLIVTVFYAGSAPSLLAQGQSGTKPAATAPAGEKKLTAQESRGEALFVQRCSVCHIPRKIKTGSPPMRGPSLNGVFKNASPDDEEALINQIKKGSINMPGFQYGLDQKDLDDLVAFLKTW